MQRPQGSSSELPGTEIAMRAAVSQRDRRIKIEVIDQAARFEDLRQEWNALLQASASNSLFLTWEWLYTWWRHLSDKSRLFLLLVRSGEELAAIAPLMVRRDRVTRLFPFHSLEFLGTGSVGSDYLDLIVRKGMEPGALGALCEYLNRGKFVVKLPYVNRASSRAAQLARGLSEHGWSYTESVINVCPFIGLSGHNWQSYLATLGPAHRYNFHRRARKLEKEHEMRFERVETDEECQRALDTLILLHQMRWRKRGGSDALHAANLVAFHREFSRLALERSWLRLFILRLGEKAVASLYGFRFGRSFYFYQSGLDPAYGKLSVGLVTMGLSIKSALDEGAEEYDLLRGDEGYKFLWARQTRELGRFELYSPCMSGLLYKQALGIGRAAKGWCRARFHSLRPLLARPALASDLIPPRYGTADARRFTRMASAIIGVHRRSSAVSNSDCRCSSDEV